MMAGCAYGETLEPDPPANVHIPGGWENAARPLVVAPMFPAPDVGRVGDELPVRVTFIGATAAAHAEGFWESLRLGGADPMLGLGEDRILFDVLPTQYPDETNAVELPADPASVPGLESWVRVILTSPLVLNVKDERGRGRLIEQPTFSELIRAGLRVIGPLFRCYGSPLPDEIFGRVKTLAESVQLIQSTFEVVGQAKSSHRTGERWEVRGLIGEAIYGPVPVGLLPWLRWAGRLHVGTHRVAGAGGWQAFGAGDE